MKRFLSIILAIAMCIAMLPTAFAGETEDTRKTITLNLHNKNLSEKDAGALTHNETEATAAGQTAKNDSAKIADLEVNDGLYTWVSDKSIVDNEVYTTKYWNGSYRFMQYTTVAKLSNGTYDKTWKAWPFFDKAQNVMFTVKTTIPESAGGWYRIKITGGKMATGGEYAVYAGGQYVGNINNYGTDGEITTWELKNTAKLNPGDVEISIRTVKFYRNRDDKGGINSIDNNSTI
ncbi:MAG: hypothetical protein IJ949_07695, partial [Oscillospiraceae bacterium]|nr:hypothetical protein [Oscillospiraceae bacterium]